MPAGTGPAIGPISRESALDTLQKLGVTVLGDPKSGKVTLRKGHAILAGQSIEDLVPEEQLRFWGRTFEFHWLKFHNMNLDLDLDEVPYYKK